MTVRIAMLWLVVMAWGCGQPPEVDAGLLDAGDAAVDASVGPVCDGGLDAGALARGLSRSCSQGIVSSGFALRYAESAHPLGRLSVFLRPEVATGCAAGTVLERAAVVTELDPRLTEGATVLATYHVLGEPVPPPGAGWAGLRAVRGNASLDVDQADGTTASRPVLFDLVAAGLADAPAIAVVLDGFEIDTDVPQGPGFPDYDPADGYALAAFSLGVSSVARTGDDLRFDARVTLGFAGSGDVDRDRAARVARARVVLRYAVIGLPAAPTLGTIDYTSSCRPPDSETALTIRGPAGQRGVPAFTEFHLNVIDGAAVVRELTFLIDGVSHDEVTGEASMQVTGFLEGPGDAPLETSFGAEIAWLAWPDAESVAHLRYSEAVDPGHVETSLPLTP